MSCVAVYMIVRGVTFPSSRNVYATSRRLDVTLDTSFSLQAEDGNVKNCRKAYHTLSGYVTGAFNQTYAYKKRPLQEAFLGTIKIPSFFFI